MQTSHATRLIEEALVWDTHSGFMPDPSADLENLSLWRNSGVDYLSINVGFDLMPWSETLRTIAAFRHWIARHPETYLQVETASDIRRARAEHKLAVTFDIEGMAALNGEVAMVGLYHRLGVRQMLFAYNRNNRAGGGCHDEDAGLTDFGRQVIDEMNRLGMFVDVSHAGERTSFEAIEYSNQPVIFSHSNAKAVHAHGRNISDRQIRACAEAGGVIGAVGVDLFLGRGPDLPSRLSDHLEHLIQIAGPDHVGLGLDYGFPVDVADIDALISNNAEYWPVAEGYHDQSIGFLGPQDLGRVVDLMLARGHSDETLKGVLGGNFLRLAEQVWH